MKTNAALTQILLSYENETSSPEYDNYQIKYEIESSDRMYWGRVLE